MSEYRGQGSVIKASIAPTTTTDSLLISFKESVIVPQENLKLPESLKLPIEDRIRQRAESFHSSASARTSERLEGVTATKIKLTFKDLNYAVTVPMNKEERAFASI